MNMSAHNLNTEEHKNAHTKGEHKEDFKYSKEKTQRKEVQGKQKVISMMRSRSTGRKMVKMKQRDKGILMKESA